MTDNEQIITELVKRARKAQAQVENYTQEQIDNLCRSVAWQTYCEANIKVCAEIAVEETGMGNIPDKILKHNSSIRNSLIFTLISPKNSYLLSKKNI